MPLGRSIGILLLFAALGCNKEPAHTAKGYSVIGGNFCKDGQPINPCGVNSMQCFGLGNGSDYQNWNVRLSREFIANLREQPILGEPILASDGKWYHSLESIIASNRKTGMITILTPFGWYDSSGNSFIFSGLNPSQTAFYSEYKIKMKAIAQAFKGQSDVWVEVWNEPYHWNLENYNDEQWFMDMNDMINNLRTSSGFNNIILVPGCKQGQGESVLLTQGTKLMSDHEQIAFDIHAYERWLLDSDSAAIVERIQALKKKEIPVLFGEISVKNADPSLLPVSPFLSIAKREKMLVCAWLWKYDESDPGALLTKTGEPNCRSANNQWGCVFHDFLQ